jgi:ABC-type transporter MlaC component
MWKNPNILKYGVGLTTIIKLNQFKHTKLSKNIKLTDTQRFIEQIVMEIQTILTDSVTVREMDNELKRVFVNNMDIKGLSLYCLGFNKENLTQHQRNKYYDLFKHYFLKTYSLELGKYQNINIKIRNDKSNTMVNNYTMVKGTLVKAKANKKLALEWRVYTKYNNPMIRDISIGGNSLASREKDRFAIIMENQGIEGIFKILTL